MSKHIVLDANVLLHDPTGALTAFEDNHVVIPIIVLEELDHLKTRDDGIGPDAREVVRQLERLSGEGSLCNGVKLPNGGTLTIDPNHADYAKLPLGFEKKPDNIILLVAKRLQEEEEKKVSTDKKSVVLVTKDMNLRVKAKSMGMRAEDYQRGKTVEVGQLYDGSATFRVDGDLFHRLHREHSIPVDLDDMKECQIGRDGKPTDREIFPNACCKLQLAGNADPAKTALAVLAQQGSAWSLRSVKKPSIGTGQKSAKVLPRNEYQCFAHDLVMDMHTTLVTLTGPAGTGKTLIALAAGVHLVRTRKFKRIIVFRPTVEVGDPLGFLPGNVEEKFDPWMKPIISCLDLVCGDGEESPLAMMEKGKISIQPFNYIRGATYPETLIIIDEAQNLTPHVMKTALTRPGEGSKVVLTGDLAQIDSRFLDSRSNGLAKVVAAFPGVDTYGHITLKKSERSQLAELASRLL